MVRGYFSPGGMRRGGPSPSALSREGEMKEENGEASTPRALAQFLSEELGCPGQEKQSQAPQAPPSTHREAAPILWIPWKNAWVSSFGSETSRNNLFPGDNQLDAVKNNVLIMYFATESLSL